MEMDNR